jgi:Poly(ADP-ribose) polymerase catalytic domain
MNISYLNTHPLSTSDPDYDAIVKQVLSEYPRACICMIDSIVNPTLTAMFEKKRAEFEELGIPSTPIRMYHGTNATAAASIINGGFDPRYGVVMAYGKGIYFAKNFQTSYYYSQANHDTSMSHMFVCSVLPGHLTKGSSNSIVPKGYQSQGNGMTVETSQIISIPEADQMIPLYLVRFHKESEVDRDKSEDDMFIPRKFKTALKKQLTQAKLRNLSK